MVLSRTFRLHSFKGGSHSDLKRKKKKGHVYVEDARYYFVIVVVR